MDPMYFPGHVPQRRQSTPAERLFELYVERNDARWLCELRDEGAHYGVEVQLFQNMNFVTVGGSRRGHSRCNGPRQSGNDSRKAARDEEAGMPVSLAPVPHHEHPLSAARG
jgi:hypothetical protein